MSPFEFDSALECRKAEGLYRSRITLDSPQVPEVWCDGKQYLAFCSNNYLGLADHPKIIAAFQSAAAEYGVGGGASHLIVGHSVPHHKLEEELAIFTGRERSLLFANGYMANLGVVSALLGKSDAAFLDRLNHASLLDAGQLSGANFHRYRHGCIEHLMKLLEKSQACRKLIITDSVFSMDGDIAPVEKLAKVAHKHNAWLMVDDAHGLGCLGKKGGGIADYYNLSSHDLPVLMGTLGKALGVYGAFIAGDHALIETLIQFARTYIYTTSLPPAVAEASRVSLKLMQEESWRRDHLFDLIRYFRDGCEACGIKLMTSDTPIQPLVVGSAKAAITISNLLANQGILVTAIRPPTVPSETSRLRVSLSAAHSRQHIDRLIDALQHVVVQQLLDRGMP